MWKQIEYKTNQKAIFHEFENNKDSHLFYIQVVDAPDCVWYLITIHKKKLVINDLFWTEHIFSKITFIKLLIHG